MWPVTACSVARESIQEKPQIWNFLQLYTVNINADVSLTEICFTYKKERLPAKCDLLKVDP